MRNNNSKTLQETVRNALLDVTHMPKGLQVNAASIKRFFLFFDNLPMKPLILKVDEQDVKSWFENLYERELTMTERTTLWLLFPEVKGKFIAQKIKEAGKFDREQLIRQTAMEKVDIERNKYGNF